MSMSLWELAATPLSEGQAADAVKEPINLPFEKWLKGQLKQRKLALPQFLRDASNGEYLNAAVQTLYQAWLAEHAPG
ncbi:MULTISPECIES: hypothetical protein [Pseudomonas]|uniref:Uncharacterized protein n=1 Tax=Pseudomonas juntendi TaxID=2666183 RepID=A0A7W2R152_9PSED|nr:MULTISPECIES: hypothetical protein [Pseudomonas]MBA6150329.1 hypothetical protein [Pseudomonas juntendi]PYB97591.1 hypothetical protein DMX12_17935 [Pseudomonas sp. MB-090624]QOH71616.1 hypothetical protein IGB31_04175 [Pseudomonas putida]WEA19909.1 hypothetical protein PWA60_22010 [Pseudomonas juntendi]